MFSILNELKDASPGSIVGTVGSSIGGACLMYLLVAVTGYLTFGNDVSGNIVSMCKYLTLSCYFSYYRLQLLSVSHTLLTHCCLTQMTRPVLFSSDSSALSFLLPFPSRYRSTHAGPLSTLF